MHPKHYELSEARAGLELLDAVARQEEEEYMLFDYHFGCLLNHVFHLLYSVAPDLASHLATLTGALPQRYLTEKQELSVEVQEEIASWRTVYLEHPYLSDERIKNVLV